MGTVLHLRTIRLQSPEESNNLKGKVKVERQLVGLLGLRTVVRGWGSCEPCYR
jgi:hypothetical protein